MSDVEWWEKRFSAAGYLFGREPNVFLKSQAHLLRAGQKALSLADGEGRNGIWLAEQGLDVLALDFSPTAIRKARSMAAERGVVTFRSEEADLATWEWPQEEFDLIVGIFFQFAGPALRQRIFEGIKRALKPGGHLLIQGYRPKQLEYKTGGPGVLENLYTREILESAFADFASVEIREHDSALNEGSGHVGMSALIELVARK